MFRRLFSLVSALVCALLVSLAALLARGASAREPAGSDDIGAARQQSVLQTMVVTSTADSRYGTLRWAISEANQGDTISFDATVFAPSSPVTIPLVSQLLGLAGQVTIDGSNAGVVLDGSGCPADADGITITTDGATVKGLQILFFDESSVSLSGDAKENTIGGDHPAGSAPCGEGNVISGNGTGIRIDGGNAMSNTVLGNYVGVDCGGSAAIGNGATVDAGGWGLVIGGSS